MKCCNPCVGVRILNANNKTIPAPTLVNVEITDAGLVVTKSDGSMTTFPMSKVSVYNASGSDLVAKLVGTE